MLVAVQAKSSQGLFASHFSDLTVAGSDGGRGARTLRAVFALMRTPFSTKSRRSDESERGTQSACATLHQAGADEIAIHLGDHFQLDLFWTHRLTLADVRAASKLLRIELPYHTEGALPALGLALRQQAQM